VIITLEADILKGKLITPNNTLDISCIVRNELNKWRKSREIVYSMPDHAPVQPRMFPKGIWTLGWPEARTDPYLEPYFIPTDAWQFLPVWELDADRCYKKVTTMKVKDKGYGLHTSTSNTTQGCIKIITMTDLLWLVQYIKIQQSQGNVLKLKVV
jgi:hypothetical protein